MSERKRDDQTWDSWIDELITAAQARGEFDNLPGKGKPLRERNNPFVPTDRQIAYDLLQNSGHTLAWIDEAADIDRRIAEARQRLSENHARVQAQRASAGPDAQPGIEAAWRQHCETFERAVADINRTIDAYNLKAPTPQLHKLRLRLAEEYARLSDL